MKLKKLYTWKGLFHFVKDLWCVRYSEVVNLLVKDIFLQIIEKKKKERKLNNLSI